MMSDGDRLRTQTELTSQSYSAPPHPQNMHKILAPGTNSVKTNNKVAFIEDCNENKFNLTPNKTDHP